MLKFCNKCYMWHTFWRCLIRCVNMKWIQPELKALQSGHGMRDGRVTDGLTDKQTDGRGENNIPPTTSLCGGYNDTNDTNIVSHLNFFAISSISKITFHFGYVFRRVNSLAPGRFTNTQYIHFFNYVKRAQQCMLCHASVFFSHMFPYIIMGNPWHL